VPVFDEKALI